MATGMNDKDKRLLDDVSLLLRQANEADTQHLAMTKLLWAQQLLATLLRQMQDKQGGSGHEAA